MHLLNSLPVELLEHITSRLEAEDIAYLWFAGDSLLHLLLRRGGVTSLRVQNPLCAPALVSQLPALKTLHLRLCQDVGELQRYIPGVELSTWPASLEELLLDYPAALANLTAPLQSHFPKLTSLALPREASIPFEYTLSSLLEELPSTLRHLYLPDNIDVDLDLLLSLPCRLASLRAWVFGIEEEQEGDFREAKVFLI